MPKKKTKLKPVVRPFATTSIPSTSKKTASKEATPPPDDPSTATSKTSEVSDGNQPSAPINNPPQTPDPLQPLLEIVQPRVEKEINRILKTYETDYRFSNSEGFQTLSINSSLLDSVFTLYQDEYAESPRMSFGGISEQKLLQTLAITYGVLHGLGFDVDLVTTCLGAIHGVSLDEALEWVRTSNDLFTA
ncbi:hypothetical protein DL96DRAFT_30806 [Flagelloscypha sp. PMI_526]|nr:hypothetical protein DL96DRAFT_30806 [Flagelloscypha sp. PMI_526]